jgi:hypothetical protein
MIQKKGMPFRDEIDETTLTDRRNDDMTSWLRGEMAYIGADTSPLPQKKLRATGPGA